MSASPPVSPEAAGSVTQDAQRQLEKDIFGEGSDLSDEDDSDNEVAIPKRRAFPPRAGPSQIPDTQADDTLAAIESREETSDDEGDEEEGEGEEYRPATAEVGAKIPKFKKTKKDNVDDEMEEDGDDEEGGDRSERKKKKKTKKERRERRERVGVDDDEGENEEPVLNEAAERRLALDKKIDSIGKLKKPVRRKKKDDVDIVDTYHDEICERLRAKMEQAVQKDIDSVKKGLPATAKLAMLDEVMSVLRNTTLWQSIVDNQVLDAVRAFLEPIEHNRALPAIGIQNAIFEVLPKMDIDTSTLKESKLGPLVLFYSKTPRVTPNVKRLADSLVQNWSRPVIKRPSDFRMMRVDREEEMDESNERGAGNGLAVASLGGTVNGATGGGMKRKRFDPIQAQEENKGRKGARMPIVKSTQYTIAPESRTAHHSEDMQHVSRIQMDNRKFNKFARQMRANKAR